MVSYLYSFNPFIGTNETDKYFSPKNVQQHREQAPLANSLCKGERIRQEAIYFNFRLDIGVCIFNHVNEFVSTSDLMETERLKSQSTLKIFTERFLFSLFDTFMQQVVERVCRSIILLITSEQFLPIIVSNVF